MLQTVERPIGLLLNLFFVPALGIAPAEDNAQPLPLPAQFILSKAKPMIHAKECPRANEVLQARGGPTPGPGGEDSKGYHHPEIDFCFVNFYQTTCLFYLKAQTLKTVAWGLKRKLFARLIFLERYIRRSGYEHNKY